MNHAIIALFAFLVLDPCFTDVAALAVDGHKAPDLCDAVSDLPPQTNLCNSIPQPDSKHQEGRGEGKTNINSVPTSRLANLLPPHDSRLTPPFAQILLFDLLPWHELPACFDVAEEGVLALIPFPVETLDFVVGFHGADACDVMSHACLEVSGRGPKIYLGSLGIVRCAAE